MAIAAAFSNERFDLRPVAPGERPVDLIHLARHTFGDRSLEREVLKLFQRQSALLIERLRHAADSRAFIEAAHAICGSAKGIGAWRVAAAADEAERIGRADCVVSRGEALGLLEIEVTAANAYIADILSVH